MLQRAGGFTWLCTTEPFCTTERSAAQRVPADSWEPTKFFEFGKISVAIHSPDDRIATWQTPKIYLGAAVSRGEWKVILSGIASRDASAIAA
jgi:hypothetical protein